MAYEQQDMSGALFKNDRKSPDSQQPDYTGDALVSGTKLKISAWIKTAQSGKKYMSLSFSPPRDAHTSGERTYDPAPGRGPGNMPPLNDDPDVPF